MKYKLIKIILPLIVLSFIFFPKDVFAKQIAVTLQSDHNDIELLNPGDVVTYTVTLSSDGSDFKGKINYNKDVFELVSTEFSSEWQGEMSLENISVTREEVLPATSVVTFQLKSKEKAGDQTEKVVLSGISSDGQTVEDQYQYIRVTSDNNKLSSLSIENGVFDQEFNPDVMEYTATVSYDSQSVVIHSALQNNFARYQEGYSNEMTIPFTENTKDAMIRVVSQRGNERLYIIHLKRAEKVVSSNSYLSKLIPSVGYLDFKSNQFEYQITIPYNISEVTFLALPQDVNASVEIQGIGNLQVGKNEVFILVTAVNGEVSTYKVVIERLEQNEQTDNTLSSNNKLKDLIINGKKLKTKDGIFEYTYNVNDLSSLDIQVNLADSDAKYVIQGMENIQDGSELSIVVTAPNGENQEYKLTINVSETVTSPIFPIIGGILMGLGVLGVLVLIVWYLLKLKKEGKLKVKK